MFLKVPDEYMKNRKSYINDFFVEKDRLIYCLLNNYDYFTYKNVFLEIETFGSIDSIGNIVFNPQDDFPIEKKEWEWIKQGRTTVMLINYLCMKYKGFFDEIKNITQGFNNINTSPLDIFNNNKK